MGYSILCFWSLSPVACYKHSMCCTWFAQDRVCVGDGSWCSEETVKNLKLRFSVRLLLLLLLLLLYCSVLFYSGLCPSPAGSSPPPESSNFLCPLLSLSILLPVAHNVICPTTFWSSNWPYALYLPLCASNGPSNIFHSGDVSSPFLFRVGYVLDYVCHPGSLPNDGVTDSVFWLMGYFWINGSGCSSLIWKWNYTTREGRHKSVVFHPWVTH